MRYTSQKSRTICLKNGLFGCITAVLWYNTQRSTEGSSRQIKNQNAKCKTTKQNSILGDIKWSSLSGNQEEGNLEIRLKTT